MFQQIWGQVWKCLGNPKKNQGLVRDSPCSDVKMVVK